MSRDLHQIGGKLLKPTITSSWLENEGRDIIIHCANAPDEEQPLVLLRFQDLVKVGRRSPKDFFPAKEYWLCNGLLECFRFVLSLPELLLERHIQQVLLLLYELMKGTSKAKKAFLEAELESIILSLYLRVERIPTKTCAIVTLADICEDWPRLAFCVLNDSQFRKILISFTRDEQKMAIFRIISSATSGTSLLNELIMKETAYVEFLSHSLRTEVSEQNLILAIKAIKNLTWKKMNHVAIFTRLDLVSALEDIVESGKYSQSFCDQADDLIYVLKGYMPKEPQEIEEEIYRKAVSVIIRCYRRYKGRKYRKKYHQAAAKIQALFRGYKLRKVVKEAMQKKRELQEEAARRFNQVRLMKKAEKRINYLSRLKPEQAAAFLAQEKERAARYIQKFWRKTLEKRKRLEDNEEKKNASATVIQQFWRRRKRLQGQTMEPDIQYSLTPSRISLYQEKILLYLRSSDQKAPMNYKDVRLDLQNNLDRYLQKRNTSKIEYKNRRRVRTEVANTFHSLLGVKGLEDVPDHQDILIGTPLGKSSERAMKHYHHSTQQAFYEQLRLFIPKDYPAPCGSIDHQIHQQEHEDHQKSNQGSKRAPKQPLPADMKPTISSTPDPDNLIDDGSTDAQTNRRKPRPRSIPK
eukprot:TRINITY_DN8599_c0_g1_i2.p1 TRINITY_DN8599_c0_g1~~TRINITY_DN8599_c0_g1_i2.p1  ORF type:complete len:636 (-),score=92.38 TRINITY_DN8599_c0_g1_i2:190-2097(-)